MIASLLLAVSCIAVGLTFVAASHCPPDAPDASDCQSAAGTAQNPIVPAIGGVAGAAAGGAGAASRRRRPTAGTAVTTGTAATGVTVATAATSYSPPGYGINTGTPIEDGLYTKPDGWSTADWLRNKGALTPGTSPPEIVLGVDPNTGAIKEYVRDPLPGDVPRSGGGITAWAANTKTVIDSKTGNPVVVFDDNGRVSVVIEKDPGVTSCTNCQGQGSVTCAACGGSGECAWKAAGRSHFTYVLSGIPECRWGNDAGDDPLCPRCNGSGNCLQCQGFGRTTCPACGGAGRMVGGVPQSLPWHAIG